MPTVAGNHRGVRLRFTISPALKFFNSAIENLALRFHALAIARVEMFSQAPRFSFFFRVEELDHRAGCIHAPGSIDPWANPKAEIVGSHLAVFAATGNID